MRWRSSSNRYDYEWVLMIIGKLVSCLYFCVGYWIIIVVWYLLVDWWCDLCGDELL
jgi:uncharacterized membrane protein